MKRGKNENLKFFFVNIYSVIQKFRKKNQKIKKKKKIGKKKKK